MISDDENLVLHRMLRHSANLHSEMMISSGGKGHTNDVRTCECEVGRDRRSLLALLTRLETERKRDMDRREDRLPYEAGPDVKERWR